MSRTDDGVGGEEGTFCLCTLWCIEALTRAGQYDKAMLSRAVAMFEVKFPPSEMQTVFLRFDLQTRISCSIRIMSVSAQKRFQLPVKG